jgi:hypothetical protein
LLLASRQLTSHTIEPKRRLDGLKLVQVAYAEALRLLHELVEYLDKKGNTPLPDLPFSGQHATVPVQPESAEPRLVALLVQGISQTLGNAVDRHQPAGVSYYIDYLVQPSRRLFARIHTKSGAPALYLACRPKQLDDPYSLAQPVEEGELHSRIALTAEIPMPAILDLVRQAYQIVAPTGTAP